MRRIALTAAILALTVAAGAQAPKKRLPITRMSGQEKVVNGNVTHFTGQARVWFDNGVEVVADEALVNLTTNEIEFRGAVRMTVR